MPHGRHSPGSAASRPASGGGSSSEYALYPELASLQDSSDRRGSRGASSPPSGKHSVTFPADIDGGGDQHQEPRTLGRGAAWNGFASLPHGLEALALPHRDSGDLDDPGGWGEGGEDAFGGHDLMRGSLTDRPRLSPDTTPSTPFTPFVPTGPRPATSGVPAPSTADPSSPSRQRGGESDRWFRRAGTQGRSQLPEVPASLSKVQGSAWGQGLPVGSAMTSKVLDSGYLTVAVNRPAGQARERTVTAAEKIVHGLQKDYNRLLTLGSKKQEELKKVQVLEAQIDAEVFQSKPTMLAELQYKLDCVLEDLEFEAAQGMRFEFMQNRIMGAVSQGKAEAGNLRKEVAQAEKALRAVELRAAAAREKERQAMEKLEETKEVMWQVQLAWQGELEMLRQQYQEEEDVYCNFAEREEERKLILAEINKSLMKAQERRATMQIMKEQKAQAVAAFSKEHAEKLVQLFDKLSLTIGTTDLEEVVLFFTDKEEQRMRLTRQVSTAEALREKYNAQLRSDGATLQELKFQSHGRNTVLDTLQDAVERGEREELRRMARAEKTERVAGLMTAGLVQLNQRLPAELLPAEPVMRKSAVAGLRERIQRMKEAQGAATAPATQQRSPRDSPTATTTGPSRQLAATPNGTSSLPAPSPHATPRSTTPLNGPISPPAASATSSVPTAAGNPEDLPHSPGTTALATGVPPLGVSDPADPFAGLSHGPPDGASGATMFSPEADYQLRAVVDAVREILAKLTPVVDFLKSHEPDGAVGAGRGTPGPYGVKSLTKLMNMLPSPSSSSRLPSASTRGSSPSSSSSNRLPSASTRGSSPSLSSSAGGARPLSPNNAAAGSVPGRSSPSGASPSVDPSPLESSRSPKGKGEEDTSINAAPASVAGKGREGSRGADGLPPQASARGAQRLSVSTGLKPPRSVSTGRPKATHGPGVDPRNPGGTMTASSSNAGGSVGVGGAEGGGELRDVDAESALLPVSPHNFRVALDTAKEERVNSIYGWIKANRRVLRQFIMEIDRDNSGTISEEELRGLFKLLKYHPPAAVMAQLMAELDVDGDGTVNVEELLAADSEEEGPSRPSTSMGSFDMNLQRAKYLRHQGAATAAALANERMQIEAAALKAGRDSGGGDKRGGRGGSQNSNTSDDLDMEMFVDPSRTRFTSMVLSRKDLKSREKKISGEGVNFREHRLALAARRAQSKAAGNRADRMGMPEGGLASAIEPSTLRDYVGDGTHDGAEDEDSGDEQAGTHADHF
eukprot:jgi/Mesvir1/13134/Mv06106-RA.1